MSTPQFLPAWLPADGPVRAERLLGTVSGAGSDTGVHLGSAPGRVNLIGEHTDYNEGLSLPIALPHRTFVAARARDDDEVRLVSSSERTPWTAALADVAPGRADGWGAYVVGVAWALAQEGIHTAGFDLAVASCVPYGAGLSSSAALECATLMALRSVVGPSWTGPDLQTDEGRAWAAGVCVRAENEIAGAPTGGMDQAASLRCQPGHALLLDVRSGEVAQVPFDLAAASLELLVIDTRAEHALVDGQYAQRREACRRAAQLLGVPSLREIEVGSLDAVLAQLPDQTLGARVRHVVTEIARVQEFVEAVHGGQWDRAGALMDASHASLRDDYEVSCTELDVAVDAASAAGALGARMTGGGFGGSAIALVEQGRAEFVAGEVTGAFARAGFASPSFLLAEACAPAH